MSAVRFIASLPARYGLDAADRFPYGRDGCEAEFNDGERAGQIDVICNAAGLDWLRADAALYVDPNYFHAGDLPPGLRAAARVAEGRLADVAGVILEAVSNAGE